MSKPASKRYLEELLRVNHSGEYGAKRIYEGQLAFTDKKSEDYKIIQHMKQQEIEHLEYFEQQLQKKGVRPSLLLPLWHVGGFALGAVTAILGNKSAYACTEAVENVIDNHYKEQLETISTDEYKEVLELDDLKEKISKFRDDEIEHKNEAVERLAQRAPFYPLINAAISNISKISIAIAKKI